MTQSDLNESLVHAIEKIKELKAELAAAREALQLLWNHIESGTLVRDISKDGQPDWVIKMLRLTMDLKKAKKALGGQP